MTDELRIRLWNYIINVIENLYNADYKLYAKFLYEIWDSFFHKEIGEIKNKAYDFQVYLLNKEFQNLEWYRVYDFIDFFYFLFKANNLESVLNIFAEGINHILEEEYAPYRIIEGQITPITDEYEIQTIKKAFENADKYKPVKDYLEKALKHLSNRTNPDYVNSIKESVLALESLANLIFGTSGKTLTSIHQKLYSQLKCPKPVEKQIREYYDWASKEEGIRHAKTEEEKSTIGQAEARLFLVQISGLINYLIGKFSRISGFK